MARMSKEAHLRKMERVNEGEGRNYRVPPSIWETPEEYLTPGEKTECTIINGMLYSGLCILVLGAIGIGSCVYKVYNWANTPSNQRRNQQVLVQPTSSDIEARIKREMAHLKGNYIVERSSNVRKVHINPGTKDATVRYYYVK